MNEIHLNYLLRLGENNQGYVGNNSLNWANAVHPNYLEIDHSLNRQLDRYDLIAYSKDQNNNHLNVLIAILSWGGMRRSHGRLLFANLNHLLPIIENLRNGIYQSRKAAFEAFQQERNLGHLPGLGIGYFTKLICFLSPSLNGYIMDQWVSKSINLLTGKNIISITSNSWVNDSNDSGTYEIFCDHIDQIAVILNCDGLKAEERLFSVGRGQGEWRNYLIDNYHSIKTLKR
jgi:hypothetical protein